MNPNHSIQSIDHYVKHKGMLPESPMRPIIAGRNAEKWVKNKNNKNK